MAAMAGSLLPIFATASGATTTTAPGTQRLPGGVTIGPPKQVILEGRWVTGGPIQIKTTGHISVKRLWDAFNNCVEMDGTQLSDFPVTDGMQSLVLGVTTVSKGWCGLERSKMHWLVTALDSNGKPTNNTADISLNQGEIPTHALDYTWECEKTTGTMRCGHEDFLGILVYLSWS